MTITYCYGKRAFPYYPTHYAAGLGKDCEITSWCDKLARRVQRLFPSLDFEVRCNTDGLSGGAYCDKIGLGVHCAKFERAISVVELEYVAPLTIVFSASAPDPDEELPAEWRYNLRAHSPRALEKDVAFDWLKAWRKIYRPPGKKVPCPICRGKIQFIHDSEFICLRHQKWLVVTCSRCDSPSFSTEAGLCLRCIEATRNDGSPTDGTPDHRARLVALSGR